MSSQRAPVRLGSCGLSCGSSGMSIPLALTAKDAMEAVALTSLFVAGVVMRVDLFDFDLPEELIALRPARPRDSARLLNVPADGVLGDLTVRDAPALFRRGDLLVFNDTRVIPAR